MDIEPFGGGFLAPADLVAHNRIEDLGATSGDRAKPGFTQSFQRVANRHFENSLSQMPNLDRGKCLDVQVRIERAQPPQEVQIPIFLQRRMQTAYHMHLGDTQGKRVPHSTHDFVSSIFERVRVAFPGCKRAELTG